MLSDHSKIKLKVSYRKMAGKSQNTWRLNNTLLKDTRVREEFFFFSHATGLAGF